MAFRLGLILIALQVRWESCYPIQVYVDNVLPMCGTARSAYYSMIKELFDDFFNRDSTGMDKTDFWVPLLEKAFAKFCGSYRMLIAGHPVRGLSYLTGGICVRMTLDRDAISTFEKYQGNLTSIISYKLYDIILDHLTNPVSADLYCDLDLHIKTIEFRCYELFRMAQWKLRQGKYSLNCRFCL